MKPRRRWFQYSLRSFLILLTASAVWLGWRVDRAHRRGQAIDAIATMGTVIYNNEERLVLIDYDPVQPTSHLWDDLKGTTVGITLSERQPLAPRAYAHLSDIYGLTTVIFYAPYTDDDVSLLAGLTDAKSIMFYRPHNITPRGRDVLRRLLPNAHIAYND